MNINHIEPFEKEQMNEIQSTPYRVSTMTATGNIHSIIDLDTLYQHLVINEDLVELQNDDIPIGKIIYAEFGNNKHDRICKGVNSKKKNVKKQTKKNTSTKRFDNSITLLLQLPNGNNVNVKLFKNGKIQMTGVKREQDGNDVIHSMIRIVKKINIELLRSNEHIVENMDHIYASELSIHLINSDFKVNIEIRRDLLYKLLIEEYEIICTYEPCIYPGVKIQYYINDNIVSNTSNFKQGQCICIDKICNGKGTNTNIKQNCKKITISVFQSGCILITGVTKTSHIEIGYNFIVNLIQKHAHRIKRVKLQLLG